MYEKQFAEFTNSGDSLWVFEDSRRVFTSAEKMLLPLLRYIKGQSPQHGNVVIFDKIIGNAAALLLVIAGCSEAYTPLASRLALDTLDQYKIKCRAGKIVPLIQRAGTNDSCPMEKLSAGKNPQELYKLLINAV